MYVYYIVMKIYVFICTNIFSHFYCLCITSVPDHFVSWISHTKIMSNFFKTKISMFSQFYSIKFCTYAITYLHKVKVFSKVTNIYLYINQKKITHGTIHNKITKAFHMNYCV